MVDDAIFRTFQFYTHILHDQLLFTIGLFLRSASIIYAFIVILETRPPSIIHSISGVIMNNHATPGNIASEEWIRKGRGVIGYTIFLHLKSHLIGGFKRRQRVYKRLFTRV